MLLKCLQQELQAALCDIRQVFTSLLFFTLILCLLPIISDSTQNTLTSSAPGFIWFACVISLALQLPQLFKDDAVSGVLHLYLTSPIPLTWLVIIKVVIHALMPLGIMLFLVPFFALIYQLNLPTIFYLLLTLSIGLPIMCLLGAAVSALLVNSRQGSVFLLLLLLPLFVPVLILGVGIVQAATQGFDITSGLSMLLAISCLSWVVLPPTIAACLRIGLE